MPKWTLSAVFADDDAEDTYQIELDLDRPAWSWTLDGAGDRGTQRFAAAALERAKTAQWLSQGSAVVAEGAATKALPACLISRAAYDALVGGKEVELPGLWDEDGFSVAATRVTKAKLVVADKPKQVPIVIAEGDATVSILTSRELPLVLALDAGDCRLATTTLSALPKLDTVTLPKSTGSGDSVTALYETIVKVSTPDDARTVAIDKLASVVSEERLTALFRAYAFAKSRMAPRYIAGVLDRHVGDPAFARVVDTILRATKGKQIGELQRQVANYFGDRHAKVKTLVATLRTLAKELPEESRELAAMALENITSK